MFSGLMIKASTTLPRVRRQSKSWKTYDEPIWLSSPGVELLFTQINQLVVSALGYAGGELAIKRLQFDSYLSILYRQEKIKGPVAVLRES